MNCDECKERVLDLIERESVDPVGVHELLERCPDCRALFDEMKSALAQAEALPLEEPPVALDAAIMKAAAARRSGDVVPLRRRRLRAPEWAMAAVALLAVGIGVWAIPATRKPVQEDKLAAEPAAEAVAKAPAVGELAEYDTADAVGDEPAEDAPPVEEQEVAPEKRRPKRVAYKKRKTEPAVGAKEDATGASASKGTTRRRSLSKARQAAPSAPAESAAPAGQGLSAADEEAASLEAIAAPDRDDARARPESLQKNETEACRKTIAALKKQKRENARYEPPPEKQLELGRCYRLIGDSKQARLWLERAAAHRETQKRAKQEIRKLNP